jgi:chorismate mutase
MDAKQTAARLLDAQVEFVIGELSSKRLAQVIARDVDDLLELGARLTVADVVDPAVTKQVLRRLIERISGSPLLEDLVTALSDAIYDLSASENYRLGEVVDREPVEALVVKLLSMHTLHDRALERLAESPLVATIATRFVTKIVGDFLNQNRQLAEKLPGARSLISFGMGAANKVRSATVDQFLGDAAGKSTQYAIRRTNSAMRDLLREAPLQGAAMEIWGLHADEPISDLRGYLSQDELRELVVLVHELVTSARSSEYVGELVDECVDVFLAEYGTRDLASLLPELGITRDDLVDDLREVLPPLIEAAKSDGRLEALVRARLKPFFASKQVQTILAAD